MDTREERDSLLTRLSVFFFPPLCRFVHRSRHLVQLPMVGRAKSNRVKAHENAQRAELRIAAALREHQLEHAKPAALGKPKSIRAIAEKHKVSYGTLNRRLNQRGRRPRRQRGSAGKR
jgi:hypothetical protein